MLRRTKFTNMDLTGRKKRNIALGIALAFILANSLLIAFEIYWLPLLPVVLLLGMLYFLSMEKILLLITLLTPLSVNLELNEARLNLIIPTEPLLIGMLLVLLLKFFHQNPFDKKVWTHPISLLIIFQLLWMLTTSLTSELPLVSLKYFISRLWFVIPVYFFGILVFKSEKRIRSFLLLFLIPLAGVVVYTTIKHYNLGFDGKAAHWVMEPFFNDHTAYGAILAMFLPISVAFTMDRGYSRSVRLLLAVLMVILAIGIVLSVSRAAWVSIAAALILFIILRFRIRFKYLALGGLLLVALGFAFQGAIISRMERNTQESEETDIAKHAQSISNITTDPSNMERLNRWSAGLRMFKERPFWGWGPGTYQFVYAPFQNSADLTIISTNAGDMGNIHSEYFGPICDSGILGGILMLALVISLIAVALRILHSDLLQPRLRRYLMAVFLGLTTYFVHGFLNNFLDTDKASVPFWGFAAIIVAVDLFILKSGKTKIEKPVK